MKNRTDSPDRVRRLAVKTLLAVEKGEFLDRILDEVRRELEGDVRSTISCLLLVVPKRQEQVGDIFLTVFLRMEG